MLDPPQTVPLQIWRQGAKARATAILWLVKASNSRQNSPWQQISSQAGRKKRALGKRKLKLITELIFSFFLLPFSPPLWTLSCWWYQTSNFHNSHKLHHLDNIHHLSSALLLHAPSEKKNLLRMLQSSEVKQQNQNKQKSFLRIQERLRIQLTQNLIQHLLNINLHIHTYKYIYTVNRSKDGECTAHPKTKKRNRVKIYSPELLQIKRISTTSDSPVLSCLLLSLLKIEAVVASK